jgi:hypothetical protein
VVNRKVSKEEMVARVSQMYSGRVKVKECPKAHSLKRPTDLVVFLVIHLQACELQIHLQARELQM